MQFSYYYLLQFNEAINKYKGNAFFINGRANETVEERRLDGLIWCWNFALIHSCCALLRMDVARLYLSDLNYPFFCWLLCRVKIPANVDGRTRTTSDTFERVGFSYWHWLFWAADQYPQWLNWKSKTFVNCCLYNKTSLFNSTLH